MPLKYAVKHHDKVVKLFRNRRLAEAYKAKLETLLNARCWRIEEIMEQEIQAVLTKFVCRGVVPAETNKATVYLEVVTGGSEENQKFWNSTPAGTATIQLDNPQAIKFFEENQEYYLTFEPAN